VQENAWERTNTNEIKATVRSIDEGSAADGVESKVEMKNKKPSGLEKGLKRGHVNPNTF